MNKQGELTFTLDIGTRTVIGLVMEHNAGEYRILASSVAEHEERAMLDGQIHNVNLVANQVRRVKEELETELDIKLERVSIAAAGRALKTIDYEDSFEFEEKKLITEDDVKSLEFSAIQKAQTQLATAARVEGEPRDYHFVGYSIKENYLDGMSIGSLEGHKGKKIETKIIATFLPRIVVDSLLTVVNKADLEVEYLTLEPIAAANVVIPKDMYNFNLALIDIGAGTSDIALTKGGTMMGYAMVPVAGDEITESLAEKYLLDYGTGEKIKRSLHEGKDVTVRNILSQELVIKAEDALSSIDTIVQSLASQISEAILMLNNKPPQAVICIGGGSLTPRLLENIAKFLELSPERVGIKEYSDIKNVSGEIDGISTAQANTPIGIAISSYLNKDRANFIDVKVNGYNHQIFTLNKATIADALLAAEIDFKKLQGNPGLGLTCTVNGELKVLRGEIGTPGHIIYNGEEISDLEINIESEDDIEFVPGIQGEDASGKVGDVVPELTAYTIKINGQVKVLRPKILQNGLVVTRDTELKDGAEIEYDRLETMRDLIAKVYDRKPDELLNEFISYTINNEEKYIPRGELLILGDNRPIDLDIPIDEDMELTVIQSDKKSFTVNDIINTQLNESITIIFNGNKMKVPTQGNLYCNGEKIEGNKQIKNGDDYVYRERKINVRQVFDYVNYKVTPFLNTFRLSLNGHDASLDEYVEDGDRLELVYDKDSDRLDKSTDNKNPIREIQENKIQKNNYQKKGDSENREDNNFRSSYKNNPNTNNLKDLS
ncbi:MAG: cell division protein FtsA [Halanaerobiales bacterium]